MKAYSVMEETEYTGGIVFADHDIVAKRQAADEWTDGEIGAILCRRAPWADRYYGGQVPARVMVDHGWHFECSGCDNIVDEGRQHDRGLSSADVIGTQYSHVFCSKDCAKRYYRLRYREKQQERAAIECLRMKVEARFLSGAVFTGEDHAYVKPTKHGWSWLQIIVSFEFPGMQYGPAQLRYDAWQYHEARQMGPRKPYYTVPQGDQPAFVQYLEAAGLTPVH